MKKLKNEITRVKHFNIQKHLRNSLCNYLITCEGKICFIFYINGKIKDLKYILKYYIVNGEEIKKNYRFFGCMKHYELYHENEFCGEIIIPRKWKQNAKDFLKEMLFSIYGIKLRKL